ncbi:hypothetical protein [Ruminiclostridium cellobioparum]|uniref:Uncharacterized protein n=1 Tax=Ruminiclostridium cellobioparum subsp. termitidis CT1112 TaxID=1195236 RepID=S0FIS1_RUMCE|nr:hypothetical protein [Ruminiclostridium cellobioparum]EMS70096.1 hypothetical protein CTER_4268 [Ruminiclostridium cellobioparum subsp. termitidis CT1112]
MKLYHYFEKEKGPFCNLSDLSLEDAENALNEIRKRNQIYAAKRDETYIKRRFKYEDLTRKMFLEKGGKAMRSRPHYMTVEECAWLKSWYKDGCSVIIDIKDLDTDTISFTYGDMFPTFGPRGDDSAEYRKQVYTYEEILQIIQKYGLPQKWNPNGEKGPIRYIEAQLWSNTTVSNIVKYCEKQ